MPRKPASAIRDNRKTLYAPQIKRLVPSSIHDRGHRDIDAATKEKVDELFRAIDRFEPVGEDNLHEFWVRAARGPIEAFGDYDDLRECGEVESRKEFEEWWKSDFPAEETWFLLQTAEYKGFRTIAVNRRPVIEIDSREEHGEWLDLTGFVDWAIAAVRDCEAMLKAGTYAEMAEKGVDLRLRTGTVARSDYWRVFPEDKEDFLKNFSAAEIDAFERAVIEQGDDPYAKPKSRLATMTANDFYRFCAIGYRANRYPGLKGKSPRRMYEAHADGRDEGLGEIDADSPEAFDRWYNDRERRGGHPWEVCRGGNSTHVSLYVRHDEGGWFLDVDGRSWGRSVETAKFFLALKKAGVPVVVSDARELLARFRGTDRIGIVPENIFPRYCESWFPGERIIDFMNLPCEKDVREKLVSFVSWQPLETDGLKLAGKPVPPKSAHRAAKGARKRSFTPPHSKT